MWSASRTLRFELATRLRDAHEDLTRLSTFLEKLREVRRYGFVYPVIGQGGRENWYLIRGGQILSVQRGPQDLQTGRACLKVLDSVFPKDGAPPKQAVPEDLDLALLIGGWFRKHAGELKSVLSPGEARSRCR